MNDFFQALSDPTRRSILRMLKCRDMTAGEISEKFNMSKPSISHHLNILKGCELVSVERKGQNTIYSINMTVFQELVNWFVNFMEKGENNGDEKN